MGTMEPRRSPSLWARLKDDRHRPVPTFTSRGMWRGQEAWFALRAQSGHDMIGIAVRLALAVVSATVFSGLAWWLGRSLLTGSKYFFTECLLFVLTFGWFMTQLLALRQFWVSDWRPDAVAWRRSCRVCGACRYPLTNAPDPDGCTVCPECGAAWKLPPPPPNNPA